MTKPRTKSSATAKPPGETIAFRAPAGTLAALDAEAHALQTANPGLGVTRSDAARRALLLGLERGRGVAPSVEV